MKILYIEDHAASATVACNLLTHRGYTVEHFPLAHPDLRGLARIHNQGMQSFLIGTAGYIKATVTTILISRLHLKNILTTAALLKNRPSLNRV